DADAGVGVGKTRLFGGDQDIAHQRQFEAAGDGDAVDGADQRAIEAEDRGHQVVGGDIVESAAAADFLQVEAGAERAAAAGEDGGVDRVVFLQAAKGVDQGAAEGAGEGVESIGAIEGENRDAVAVVAEDKGFRHQGALDSLLGCRLGFENVSNSSSAGDCGFSLVVVGGFFSALFCSSRMKL